MPYTPMQLAEAFLRTGELTDALDALNQQLSAEPDDPQARRMRIALLLQLGEPDHLRDALADSRTLPDPSAEDLQRRSVILERLGDLAGALAAIDRARQLAPDDERLAERALHLLLASDNLADARELIATQPQTWRWLGWSGDLAGRAGAYQAALGHYDAALAHLETQFDLASNPYARALRARMVLARAGAAWQIGQLERAEADYAIAETIIPDEPMIPFGRGLLAALRGDLDTAAALCSPAFASASETLQDNMRAVLADARFRALASCLNL